jgi:hypothetical protein
MGPASSPYHSLGRKISSWRIIGVALRRMAADLESHRSPEVVEDVIKEVSGVDGHSHELEV